MEIDQSTSATPAAMPLQTPLIHIYTRHAKDCAYQGDESWKRCTCWKWLRWRADGELHREPTKSRTWAGAERVKHKFESSFEAAQHGHTVATTPVTVQQAFDMFMAKKSDLAKETLKKYRQTLGRLLDFCNQESRYYITAVTESELQKFKTSFSSDAAFTRRNHQERLRAFFRYCCASNEIRLPYNPTSQLESIDLSDQEPTPPFTPKEYDTILATISNPAVGLTKRQQLRIHGMIQTMRHAGLAIQDAAILERDQVHKTKLHGKACYRIVIRRSKTGVPVNNPIPEFVGEELLKILNGNTRYVFWTGNGEPASAVKYWHRLFKKLFDVTGIVDAHPHRFRDTFAVTLLENGVPIREVSRALGHKSITTTERHYAKWTPDQQNRMDDYIAATWTKKKKVGAAQPTRQARQNAPVIK
jgi:integrase/recombinase XerD